MTAETTTDAAGVSLVARGVRALVKKRDGVGMPKTLKLWNGRPYGVLPQEDWKTAHIFVAAYSAADARRVCVEAGQSDPGANEVSKYWSAGCWGNSMDGVTPERGLWVVHGFDGVPQRVRPNVADKRGARQGDSA